ncbi:MAG: M48 family peptidase [Sphingomonadaceae bacterium]|nr:M48 family peptidase [Sphingomonadaceae bacterium]
MIDWLRRRTDEVPQVEIDGRLLPLALRRNAAAKRMTMRLAPDGSEVRVTLPRWGRSAEALEFARSKADWLAVQLAKVPQAPALIDGAGLLYRGRSLPLRHDAAAPRKVRLGDGELHVGGPADSLHRRLQRWLEDEALRLLADDLAYYCLRAERRAPPLTLSRAQRRWGSCAADGTIRINWRLIMAPDYVRRSVVAHEVAHLAHFDHSPAFHTYLEGLFEGDVGAANRWLKRDGRSLYAHFG